MNLIELNNEFEVLFEDLATAGSKGLDAYEKSLCFTYSQDSLIKAMMRQGDLENIQSSLKYDINTSDTPSPYRTGVQYTRTSELLFTLDYFLRSTVKDIPVVPISTESLTKFLASPYQYAPKDLAYVVMGEDTIIVFPPFSFNQTALVTRCIEEPTPIILENLSGGLTIKGLSAATEPILKDNLQTELVNSAVQFAIKIYVGQPEKEVGNASTRN